MEHPVSDAEKEIILNGIEDVNNLKIVTGVRDPVARDVSLVFELLLDGVYYEQMNRKGTKNSFLEDFYWLIAGNTPLRNFELPENYNLFDYINCDSVYGSVFDWFDKELKEYFKIDVFAEDFDREKGYAVIRKDNVEVFVYKMEKLNEPDLMAELRKFLEIPNFEIRHENNSENKGYSLTYQQALNEIKMKKEYLDCYYKDNPRMRHFYTEEEIECFREKWYRQ